METETFNSELALLTINRSAKKYQNAIIITMISAIVISVLIMTFFINNAKDSNVIKFVKVLELHSSLILLVIFFLSIKTRIGKYFGITKIILIQKSKSKSFTLSHFIRVSIRALVSFLLFFIISFIPLIIMISSEQFNHNFYSKYAGSFFALVFIVFTGCYGGILLPELIARKINKAESFKYKYIYWFYFIKGRMSSSGFTLFIAIPLILLTTTIIIISTFTFETTYSLKTEIESKGHKNELQYKLITEPQVLNFANFREVGRFSLFVSSFGVWLTIITLIISDILKNYSRIYAVYEDYTSYILRERLLNGRSVSHILIGYGRLNRQCLANLIKNQIIEKDVQDNPMNYFEIIIDKQLNFRFISRKTSVVDKNSGVFEELSTDQNSGITFGFIDSGNLEITEQIRKYRIREMATFGIVGNGGEESILKAAGIDSADIIIHASSSESMGFTLKNLIEDRNDASKPVIITTVRDSSNFSFLELKNNLAIFPVNPYMTEGMAMGSRLFIALNKIVGKNQDGSDINSENIPIVVLLGRSKAVYYTIKQFAVNAMATGLLSEDTFIKENFIIVSDDQHLKNNSFEENDVLYWRCEIGHNKTINPMLNIMAPDYYDSIKIAIKKANNNKSVVDDKRPILFIVLPNNPMEGLKIVYNTKQIIGEHPHLKAAILGNVENQWLKGYIDSIENLQPRFRQLLGKVGFPLKSKDLYIKKDIMSGSQLTSLMECLEKEKPEASYRRYSDKNNLPDKTPKTGIIAICANNHPGILAETLCLLSGVSGLKPIANCSFMPSFYYSYSFRVGDNDQKWKDTFIIRGDCQLVEFKESRPGGLNHLKGISMNGTQLFLNEYSDYLKSKIYNDGGADGCGFHPMCPVSTYNDIIDSKNNCDGCNAPVLDENKSKRVSDVLASVKIWADYDSVPGALAVALCDFLMIGSDLQLVAEENNNPILNIVYESCHPCTWNNMLTMRIFTKASDVTDPEIREQRSKLMDKSNIIGVKIKLNKTADNYWKEHFKQLKDYANNICESKYDSFEMEDEFHLFRQEIRTKEGARAFFDTL